MSLAPGNYQHEAETQIMQPGGPDIDQGVNPLPRTPASLTTPISPPTPTPPIAQA